jgi:hypothetical protein
MNYIGSLESFVSEGLKVLIKMAMLESWSH